MGHYLAKGHIEIVWEIDSNGAEPTFLIRWTERNGPSIVAPAYRGSGTTVVTKMVEMNIDGEALLDFAPTGLIWETYLSAQERNGRDANVITLVYGCAFLARFNVICHRPLPE